MDVLSRSNLCGRGGPNAASQVFSHFSPCVIPGTKKTPGCHGRRESSGQNRIQVMSAPRDSAQSWTNPPHGAPWPPPDSNQPHGAGEVLVERGRPTEHLARAPGPPDYPSSGNSSLRFNPSIQRRPIVRLNAGASFAAITARPYSPQSDRASDIWRPASRLSEESFSKLEIEEILEETGRGNESDFVEEAPEGGLEDNAELAAVAADVGGISDYLMGVAPSQKGRRGRAGLVRILRKVYYSRPVQASMTVIIFANLLVNMWMVTVWARQDVELGSRLRTLDYVFFGIYSIDLVIQTAIHRLNFFTNKWRLLDLFCIAFALLGYAINQRSLSVLRTVRCVRMVKLLLVTNDTYATNPQFVMLAHVFSITMPFVLWIVLGGLFFNVIYSIIGIGFFGESHPTYFVDIPDAMLTMFQVTTLDHWSHLLDLLQNPAFPNAGWAPVFIFSWIVLSNLVISRLALGCVAASLMEAEKKLHALTLYQQSRQSSKEIEKMDAEIQALMSKLVHVRAQLPMLVKLPSQKLEKILSPGDKARVLRLATLHELRELTGTLRNARGRRDESLAYMVKSLRDVRQITDEFPAARGQIGAISAWLRSSHLSVSARSLAEGSALRVGDSSRDLLSDAPPSSDVQSKTWTMMSGLGNSLIQVWNSGRTKVCFDSALLLNYAACLVAAAIQQQHNATAIRILNILDFVFVAIFCFEFAGLLAVHSWSKLARDPSFIFDCGVNAVAIGTQSIGLQRFSCIRALRLTVQASRLKRLRWILVSVWHAIPQLVLVMAILLTSMLVFAIIGCQCFRGKTRSAAI